jgi:hypothetical protein
MVVAVSLTRMTPNGKNDSQIGHILIDRRLHSTVLDVRYLKGADCNTDHYLTYSMEQSPS